MDSQDTNSKNSANWETGSQVIVISKPPKSCDNNLIRNGTINPSNSNSPGDNFDSRQPQGHVEWTTSSKDTTREFCKEGQVYRDRNPAWVNCTSNVTSNSRMASSSFHSAILNWPSPQSVIETKHDHDEKQLEVSAEPCSNSVGSCPLPVIEGPRVIRLMSRLTSFISSRSLDSLDEEALNNFNLEVGTVASRVDMWRQRLEDERTHSVRSHSSSGDTQSSFGYTPSNQANNFITDEIRNLIVLTRDLTNSLFGRFSWGLLGMEGRLMLLLERGSDIVFPAAEVLIVNIWGMLKKLLDLDQDDAEKSARVHSAAEAINNAYHAIRSLIHLGKAYRNVHESSDGEYTAENLGSLAGSLANMDTRP